MDKENIFTVSEVTSHIKNILESNIPNLFITGEIANFTRHRSGHIYFSLKDANSSIRCVFFKSYNLQMQFQPKDGDQVICFGKATVFEKSGNYQLNIMKMFPSGIGELQLKFEELKQKLDKEGLFDTQHKKEIPAFPEKIGVITSETGAAIKDIKNVISRRYPCKIFLYPATVQGKNAAGEIISGIKHFNEEFKVDVLIVGRGGGSQDDLFCFNDEALAREIFKSEIPVISAVGHEIDFTISDLVADLRAPTPSAAAELAVPNSEDILRSVRSLSERLKVISLNNLFNFRMRTSRLESSIKSYQPANILRTYQQLVDEAGIRLDHILASTLNRYRSRLNTLGGQLKELSPYNALQRGYSILRQKKRILNSINKIDVNTKVNILLSDGSLDCEVTKVNSKNE
ncbi:exodeoxyribonuclease VII large subunit [Candidatus Cloacimonadota bacterium]